MESVLASASGISWQPVNMTLAVKHAGLWLAVCQLLIVTVVCMIALAVWGVLRQFTWLLQGLATERGGNGCEAAASRVVACEAEGDEGRGGSSLARVLLDV